MVRPATSHAARCLALATLALLASCGGGDGDAADAAPPAPASPASVCAAAGSLYATYAKAGTTTGQLGAVTVAGCSGAIESPSWLQIGGPPVTELMSEKAQTLSFLPPTPAVYRFRVSFRDPIGVDRSEEVALEVGAASADTQLALRVSQSVRMGGNVSVRAWPSLQAGEAVQSITWSQVEGPVVTLDARDSHLALFVAPAVARDTLIRLRATLTTTAGRSASDEALVLIERHAQAGAGDNGALWRSSHVSRVFSHRPGGPYAAVLARCVYDASLRDDGVNSNLCPLARLPFLAQETGGALPSIEQVMNRVLVSHEWAGRNFESFLREHDGAGDFRRMLMSVTAVVIGAQVRPSFYYAATGAIYLDADNFWLTPGERDTVNEAPDYRSGFGADLQYTSLWRYVRDGRNVFQFDDPRQRITRAPGRLLDEAGWLMLHELAHALDFLPPSAYGALVGTRTPWGNIAPRYQAAQLASDRVPAAYPLTSATMAGLGQVRFFGATASSAQAAYTPQQVAAFFSADLATDDYAYASRREDVAMALEEFLMSRRLGIRRDFALTPRWGPGATGSTIPVTWGQRGRIGEPALRPRLRAIVQQLVPWIDPAEVERLDAPLAMRAGDSWTANLQPAGAPTSPRLEKTESTLQEMWLLERAQRRRHTVPAIDRIPPSGARKQGGPQDASRDRE